MSTSRIIGIISAIAAALTAVAAGLEQVQPKYALLAVTIAAGINAFTERVPGGASRKRRFVAVCLAVVLLTVQLACGPPSRKTIEKLQRGAEVVVNQIDVNITLPQQLLAAKIITLEQLPVVQKFIDEARANAVIVRDGLAVALTAEKPSLKHLAPVVAAIIANLRSLDTFVKHEMVQRFFGLVEIGLRILGSYFALQISSIRGKLRDLRQSDVQITEDRIFVAGYGGFPVEDTSRLRELLRASEPTDEDISRAAGFEYDKAMFDLLAYSYDGRRFDEYAAALP